MLESTLTLLRTAREHGYAIGAFNVYNLEGAQAVIAGAQAERSPAMLQLHPAALAQGGPPLLALCLAAGREAPVPISVHLDHSPTLVDIRAALRAGCRSVMADGSHLAFSENIAFTHAAAEIAHEAGADVEAELGRLTGTEDNLTVAEYEAQLTDPAQAATFVTQTRIEALAICIGNVHGQYRGESRLDFERLAAIQRATPALLVLHGASGLPAGLITRSIELGVCKFNVNTEIRSAYIQALQATLAGPKLPDLLVLMQQAVAAMQSVVVSKLRLFGSAGKA